MSGKLARMYDISTATSVDDILRLSSTDWDVQTVRASVGGADDGGFRALIRPDTNVALGFASQRYHANSHRAQLHSLDALVTAGDLVPVTCSVWDNGSLIAYQLRAPNLDVTIHGTDVVSPLLTLAFAYGFRLADTAFFADFRWFCKNQMGRVSSLATDRVRHRSGIASNFGDLLGRRLGELSGELSDHYAAMRRMPGKPLAGKALYEYFGESLGMTPEEVVQSYVMPAEELTGKATAIPAILDCYAKDDAGSQGSVWHAYNAVTRYETHGDPKRNRSGLSTEATRNRRMLLGAGGHVANRAFEVAARLAA